MQVSNHNIRVVEIKAEATSLAVHKRIHAKLYELVKGQGVIVLTRQGYAHGTVANVLQLLKLPDNTVKVLVEGVSRMEISGFSDRTSYLEAEATALDEPEEDEVELSALSRSVVSEFESYVKLNKAYLNLIG